LRNHGEYTSSFPQTSHLTSHWKRFVYSEVFYSENVIQFRYPYRVHKGPSLTIATQQHPEHNRHPTLAALYMVPTAESSNIFMSRTENNLCNWNCRGW